MHSTRRTVALAGAVVAAVLALPVGASGGQVAAATAGGGPVPQVKAAITAEHSALALLTASPVRAATVLRRAAADLQAAAGATGVPTAVAAELRRTGASAVAAAHTLGSPSTATRPAVQRSARVAIGAALAASLHGLAVLQALPAPVPAAVPAEAPGQATLEWCAYTTLGGVTPLETFSLSDSAGAGKRASVNMVRGEANNFSTVTLDATGAGSVTYPVPGANYILVQIAVLQPAGPPEVLLGSFFVDPLAVVSTTGCTPHR